MLITCLVDIGARGARWRALLAPIAPLPYRTVLGYTYIGYLANNVLPARLGELYRSHALGEGEGVSRPTVLGTRRADRGGHRRWFGIPKDSAFALGLLVHVMILATTSVGGVIAILAFRRRRAAAAGATPAAV